MASEHSASSALRRWILYTFLLALRFRSALHSFGYVHPDEFFQGGQELFFGCRGDRTRPETAILNRAIHDEAANDDDATNDYSEYLTSRSIVPWEFEPRHAVRSIVPPMFVTLLPLWMYGHAMRLVSVVVSHSDDYNCDYGSECSSSSSNSTSFFDWRFWSSLRLGMPDPSEVDSRLSGWEIWIVPRLIVGFLSVLFLDGSVWWIVAMVRRKRRRKVRDEDDGESPDERPDEKHRLRLRLPPPPPTEVLVLASSWPTLVFGTRPFTNTLEAMVLGWLLVIISSEWHHPSHRFYWLHESPRKEWHSWCCERRTFAVGALCSVGLFVRFTFVFYAFPAVLIFWIRRSITARERRFYPAQFLRDGMLLAAGFVAASIAFVQADHSYYSQQPWSDERSFDNNNNNNGEGSSWWNHIAPLNALLYNSQSSNLALHGLHPRITHAVVNLPMLFGPLALLCYWRSLKILMQKSFFLFASRSSAASVEARVEVPYEGDDSDGFSAVCSWVVFSALALLSCAPHQEPRFLLPCLVPLVLLHGGTDGLDGDVDCNDASDSDGSGDRVPSSETNIVDTSGPPVDPSHRPQKQRQSRGSIGKAGFWIVFNAALYVFFGRLHQGGVVPSLLDLYDAGGGFDNGIGVGIGGSEGSEDRAAALPLAVAYYRTYMPPTFLARRGQSVCQKSSEADDGLSSCDDAKEGGETTTCPNDGDDDPSSSGKSSTVSPCGGGGDDDALPPIYDLRDSDPTVLSGWLGWTLSCPPPGARFVGGSTTMKAATVIGDNFVYVVVPSSVADSFFLDETSPPLCLHGDDSEGGNDECDNSGGGTKKGDDDRPSLFAAYSSRKVRGHGGHVSTEDWPPFEGPVRTFVERLELGTYAISCK